MILHLLRVRKISVSIVSHSGLNTLHLYLVACLGYWTLWFSWQHQCIVIIKCTFQLGKYQVQSLFCRWGGRSLENEDVAAPIFQDLYQSRKKIKSENGWNKIQSHRQLAFHVTHVWKERHIILNSSLHMVYSDLLLVMLYLMLVFIRPWKNQSIEEIKFKNMNLVTCFGENTCKNGLFTPSCAPRPYSRVYLWESLNWGHNHNTSSTYTVWWKTEVVPQPFRIRYRSALWLRSNFLNPSEFPPCILTCSKKFLPWGWAIRWAISWDVRGIWTIGPTKCHSLSERPPDLSVPQCVTLSVWERRNNFLTQSAEVTNANAH